MANSNEGLLQEVLNAAKDLEAEDGKAYKEKLEAKLKEAKQRLGAFEESVSNHAKVAYKATDNYVQENPYKVIGFTAAIAFLLGLLISRR